MKKCWLALLLVLVLATVACAEETDMYSIWLPIIDEAASVAVLEDDPDLNGLYIGLRPMASELDEDGTHVAVIGDVYAAKAQIDTLSAEEYGQVRWLDAFAVATLARDESSLQGWVLESFDMEAEQEMTDAAEEYFTQTMTVYEDTVSCFSIQYPTVLGEAAAYTDADGCSGVRAAMADGTADFTVGCRGNEKGLTAETFIASLQKDHPDAVLTQNELTGVTRITWTEGNRTHAEYVIVTEASVYHAVMTWDASVNADFTLYSDYVMNSFAADELGIG